MAKKTKKVDKKTKAPAKTPAKTIKATAKAVLKAVVKKVAAPKKPAKPAKVAAPKKVVAKPAKIAPVKKAAKPAPVPKAKKEAKAPAVKVDKKAAVKAAPVDPKDKKAKAAPVAKTAVPAPAVEAKGKKAKKEAADTEQEVAAVEVRAPIKDVVLTDAEGRELCRVKDCDQPWVVESYCRYHYLLFWKKIQNRKKILSEGKLEQYIEELTSRYPLKFLELIRKDLSSEPDFFSAIQELDIDEGNNIDEFEDENFMEEVRGISSGDTERVDDEY